MECKEFESRIPDFFASKLDGEELVEFVDHVKNCKNCSEEVAIQYLATEGLVRLEEGASFSLDEELDHMIKKADQKIQQSDTICKICNGVEIAAAAIIAIATISMIW